MNGASHQSFDPFTAWAEWTKSVIDCWNSTASTWQDLFTLSKGREQRRMEQYQENAYGAWNELLSNLLDPMTVKDFQSTSSMAELAIAGANSIVDGCVQFHEWMSSLGQKSREKSESFFSLAQQDIFKAWVDFQRSEIQPLLMMPQGGFNRAHQEKLNRLFQQFNAYQSALAEFQHLLFRPMELSLREMQEKTAGNQDDLPRGDFKMYYGKWLKSLEVHYLDLFRSAEWTRALSRLVDESAGFRISRNDLIIELMQLLPVPTNRDMDEVYKELYTLKKMVKELIKKSKQQELTIQ